MTYPDPEREQLFAAARRALAEVGDDPAKIDVLEESFRDVEQPYHGVRHCISTGFRIRNCYQHYGLPEDLALNIGFFHDAGHPGLKPDRLNVDRSVYWWIRAGGSADDLVARGIRSTEFPHTYGFDGLMFDGARDADVLEVDHNPCMGARLKEEWGIDPASHEVVDSWLLTDWGHKVHDGVIQIPAVV